MVDGCGCGGYVDRQIAMVAEPKEPTVSRPMCQFRNTPQVCIYCARCLQATSKAKTYEHLRELSGNYW